MSGSTLALTITANDQTAKTIAAIEANVAKFAGGMQKNLAKFAASTQSSIGQATDTMQRYTNGLAKVNSGLRGMARYGQEAFQKVGQIVPVLGIITSAASIAGMSRMVSSWAEWGLRLSNASRQIGMGAKQLTGLQGAANLAGGSADAMASGMQNLGQVMYDSVGGKDIYAIKMFNTLRIGFQDATGHARKAADVMPEIADKIASMRDPFARAEVGVTLFGGAWQGMEPLLVLGSRRIAELTRVSEAYNYVTDASVEKARDLELAQRKVGAATEGLRNRIAERLAPILTPMLDRFSRWIAYSPVVTRGIELLGRGVSWLGVKLEEIDWDKLGARAEEWGGRLLNALKAVEAWSPPGWLRAVLGLSAADTGPNGPATPFSSAPSTNPNAAPNPAIRDAHPTNLGRWLYDSFDRLRAPDNRLHDPAQNMPGAMPTIDPSSGIVLPSPTSRSAVDPANTSAPRGIRNNNPLNLSYVPGQVGLVAGAPSDGRFGRYQTMEDGVAAAERQLLKYQVRDHLDTVRQMVSKWAPPGENDTESYVQHVARSMGISPDASVSLNNQATAAAMIAAMAKRETGRFLDASVINRGVARALNLPEQAPGVPMQSVGPQAPPLAVPQARGAPMALNTGGDANDNNGISTVRVEFGGKLPDGMNMKVANPQKVDLGGPLVERPQLLGAMP